ncbi:DUF5625 family protein [Aquitalea sp. ASV11]|uniref:DUF5625 family protein n=1 Tax=Aquitalea sp. ASV11 TaxID=2795103 RepID=UPI0018EB8006|nr:DUF5625 family protein [Aquitalea sp. ASV11]
MKRRNFLMLLGATPFTMKCYNADNNIVYTPCFFPFDASHKNVTLTKRFRVRLRQDYNFSLNFLHNGGEEAEELYQLLDDDEALFLTSSLGTDHPVIITDDDFMEKTQFISQAEKMEELNKADDKYRHAVIAARIAQFKGIKNKYSYLPQKKQGIIPLHIELCSIANDERTVIFQRDCNSIGFSSGGNGKFTRNFTGQILVPHTTYEVTVKTIQDSPLFFGKKILLGIAFDPRFIPPRSNFGE